MKIKSSRGQPVNSHSEEIGSNEGFQTITWEPLLHFTDLSGSGQGDAVHPF